MAQQDLKVLRALLERKDLRETKAPRVQQDLKVLRVQQDLKVLRVQQVPQEQMEGG